MDANLAQVIARLRGDGFAVLHGVVPAPEADAVVAGLAAAFAAAGNNEALLGTYGARNVLELWPPAAVLWRRPALTRAIAHLLGPAFGLVRVLFFDKPPGESWALPWHKDLTVAVRNNALPSSRFSKPTRKAGVPHVEAPVEVLEAMVTARLHLDEVTEENGPLKVIPGSHRTGKTLHLGEVAPVPVLAGKGDVLLMRPLLAHSSGRSHPQTPRHRRVLHFEFAARPDLPDGYRWHQFLATGRDG